MPPIVETLGYQRTIDLILEAEERVYLSLPGIYGELAEPLVEAKKKVKDVRVVVDCSEENIRNGYGDLAAIEKLRKAGIAVYDFPKNMVSFLISDRTGHLIFPQSRIFSYEDVGTNAVRLDEVTTLRLISFFFPPEDEIAKAEMASELKDSIARVTADAGTLLNLDDEPPFREVEASKIEEINKRLESNPPVHPDLQRQIKTYTAKIQFVELHFEGRNIHSAKVSIPPDALPFKDEQLRQSLETRLRLFENIKEDEGFKVLYDFIGSIDAMRKEYLVPIASREKSIIRQERKGKFTARVDELKGQIKGVRAKMLHVMAEEILNSSDRVKQELVTFFKANPPEEYKSYQASLFQRKTESLVNQIVGSIKFPEPETLLDKMDVHVNFYDLTWEDFRNQEFLDELARKEVFSKGDLKQIVSMRDAFEVKK